MDASFPKVEKSIEMNFKGMLFKVEYFLDENMTPSIQTVCYTADNSNCMLWQQNQEFKNSFLRKFYDTKAKVA